MFGVAGIPAGERSLISQDVTIASIVVFSKQAEVLSVDRESFEVG